MASQPVLIFLLFLVLTCLYFARAFVGDLLIAPGDGISQNYPTRVFFGAELRKGIFPLWLPYEFLGIPFLGSTQGGIYYPFNWLFALPFPFDVYNWVLLVHYAMGGLFTFLYLRSLALARFPAFLGGAVFVFGGFLQAHKGHNQIQNVGVFMPAMFLAVQTIARHGQLRWILGGSIVFGLQLLAGHIQTAVWSTFYLGLYIIFLGIFVVRTERMRFWARIGLMFVLGSGLAGPQIYAGWELASQSGRAFLHYSGFTFGSFSLNYLPMLLCPYFFGGGYGQACYWAEYSMTEICGFMGIFVTVIGLSTTIWWRHAHRQVIFFTFLLIVSFVLALGENTPLYRLMYHMPLYNLFRVPARNFLAFDFSITVLFAIGLHHLLVVEQERVKNCRRLACSMLGLILIMSGGIWTYYRYLVQLPAHLRLGDCRVSEIVSTFHWTNKAFWVPLLFAVLWCVWLLFWSKTQKRKCLLGVLCCLVMAELYSFGGFHNLEWPNRSLTGFGRSIDLPLSDQYRRVTIPYEQGNILFSLVFNENQLGGYDPLQIQDFYEMTGIRNNGSSIQWGNLIIQNTVLSLLSTRYICISRSKHSLIKLLNECRYRHGPADSEPGFNMLTGTWQTINAEISPDQTLLCGGQAGQLSELFQTIALKPDTNYQFTGEIKADRFPDQALSIDLFAGALFDRSEHQLTFLPSEVTDRYKRFHFSFNSGEVPSQDILLRVFSSSSERYELRKIEVREHNDIKLERNLDLTELGSVFLPHYRFIRPATRWLVYENMAALPRAYTISTLRPAASLEQVKFMIYEGQFDPESEACVTLSDYQILGRHSFSKGKVSISRYSPNRVVLQVEVPGQAGFVVLTDQYYPGWRALINDQPTTIYKVNGLVRGVVVPSGKHTLIFHYRPVLIYILTLVSLMIAASIGLLFLRRARSDSQKTVKVSES